MNSLNEITTPILIAFICSFLGFLANFLNKYIGKLKEEAHKIKNDKERALFENALQDLQTIVNVTVTATEQVVGADLKASVKNGTLPKAALVKMGDDVYEKVLSTIGGDSKNILSTNINNLEAFVKDSIESKVLSMKNQNNVIVQQSVEATSTTN